jgi:hypothetical protein
MQVSESVRPQAAVIGGTSTGLTQYGDCTRRAIGLTDSGRPELTVPLLLAVADGRRRDPRGAEPSPAELAAIDAEMAEIEADIEAMFTDADIDPTDHADLTHYIEVELAEVTTPPPAPPRPVRRRGSVNGSPNESVNEVRPEWRGAA